MKEKEKIVAVVGPGRSASEELCRLAYDVGFMIAENGWTIINGGVAHGVMDNSAHGAYDCGGKIIGVLPHRLPSETHPPSTFLTTVFPTDFGEARNTIIAEMCHAMVVVGMCPGTGSEVCFAVKGKKPIFLLQHQLATLQYFRDVLGGDVKGAVDVQDIEGMLKKVFKNLAI